MMINGHDARPREPEASFFVKESFGLCPRFGFAITDPIGNNKANVVRIII